MANSIEEYAWEVLKEHGCDEYSYYGIDGDVIIDDLKEAYPDGMEFPYIDVANAILTLSKPTLITRSPYRMIYDIGHTVDSIDFDSFDAARENALDTLTEWMSEVSIKHQIDANDISKWSENAKSDWDFMIYNYSVCVARYVPETDEYVIIWEPRYEDEEFVGWMPTDELYKIADK